MSIQGFEERQYTPRNLEGEVHVQGCECFQEISDKANINHPLLALRV